MYTPDELAALFIASDFKTTLNNSFSRTSKAKRQQRAKQKAKQVAKRRKARKRNKR